MKSSSVNIVVVTGNLVEDPELKQGSGEGTDYVRFRIGSNRRWKDGRGNEQERADFFDCVTFNGTARGLAHAKKGTEVLVHGRLQLNQWKTTEGEPRQRVEIVADSLQLLRKPRASRPTEADGE